VGGVVRIRVQSDKPGPTVVVVSGVHGDELTGTAAIHALDPWLQQNLLRGTVVLIPCANPLGTVEQSRTVPGDKRDLNRCFPGDSTGSEGPQLAAALWQVLEEEAMALLLDLHSDSGAAIPYAIADRPVALRGTVREIMQRRLAETAANTGLLWLWEYPDALYRRSGLERSLSGAVVNRLNCPAITLEIGPKARLDAKSVQRTVLAVQRSLVSLGLASMKTDSAALSAHQWCRSTAPRTTVGGLFETCVAAGESFEVGDVLGRVRAVSGLIKEEIFATEAGLVLSWNDAGWLGPGSFVGTLATAETEAGR
jgi:predicted deacylase